MGSLRADVVRDMQLEQHGLELTIPEVAVASLAPDGRALILYPTMKKAARKSRSGRRRMLPDTRTSARPGKIGKVIGQALSVTPPNIDSPSSGDLWGMLKTGRAIRNLGKKDMYRVLRWGPMAAADLVSEFFDTEPLRATVASQRYLRHVSGPWSQAAPLF